MLELDDIAEVIGEEVRALRDELAAVKAALAAQVSVASALVDGSGDLVLVMSNGETRSVGRVVGRDGTDGQDGESLSLDDFTVNRIDERTIEIGFAKGGVSTSFELAFPVPVYRSAFRDGEAYEPGDMVSFGGSTWHCAKATGAKPGEGDDWTLAVKRGRDGKDAR